MGMYTEFRIRCYLKSDTPESLIHVLRMLASDRIQLFEMNPTLDFSEEWNRCDEAKAFLSDSRYDWFGNPDTYMFDESCNWALKLETGGSWLLEIGTEIKNYDQVIQKFWAWISPWIADPFGTKIGLCEHEEFDEPSPVIVGQEIKTGTYNVL